jgi:MoaA/NifB/PqqE/SkfB family radical SAM enzyme
MNDTPWINEHGRAMERLELHLTYVCPEKCVFCSEEHRMQKYKKFPVTWGRVAKTLRLHASRGVKNVHFTGGEPTIHPKFVSVLRLAKKLGLRTSIGTIGTMLSKEKFALEALPFLDEALFSLHGHLSEIHDPLTQREGSFERVVKAIKMTRKIKPSFPVFINTVLTRQNIETLPETISFAEELGATLIIVSNTTPEGAGADVYADLAVPLEDLKRIIPQAAERTKDSVLRFFGMPMCLMGKYDSWSNDLHWDPRVTVEWGSKPGKIVFDGLYSWTPARKREHVDECQTCTRKAVCMGVFDLYIQKWDTSALERYA